jgi:hypothetical protein
MRPRPTPDAAPARLMLNLSTLFSIDELEQIETEIGARPEDIGEGLAIERAAALVDWAARNERMMALLVVAIRARPDAKWK